MQRQRRRDTVAELAIRRLLHGAGLRYRVDVPVLPGVRRRADIVFAGPRVAVFVDGCFWHCCPQHATYPARNAEWWQHKLAANVARDRDTDQRLAAAGWEVVRVWEHESPAEAAARIEAAVRVSGRGQSRRPDGSPRAAGP
jgi:DNA mismatch endonuclease (patch repair protein)